MSESARIESDLHCIACGHNLRTLAWEGKCSECGTPAERSRVPEWLTVNDLWSLRGIRMALAVLVMWIIINCWVRTIDMDKFVGFSWQHGRSYATILWIREWIPTLIYAASFALLARVAFRIGRRRYLIILAVVAVLLQLLVTLVLLFISSLPPSDSDASWEALAFLIPMSIAGNSIPFLLVLLWLRSLFDFSGRPIDMTLLSLGTAIAGCFVILDWLFATHVLHWLIGLNIELYNAAVVTAYVLIGLILIVLRRRFPIVPRPPKLQ